MRVRNSVLQWALVIWGVRVVRVFRLGFKSDGMCVLFGLFDLFLLKVGIVVCFCEKCSIFF